MQRSSYMPPAYLVPKIDLDVKLNETTKVISKLIVKPNPVRSVTEKRPPVCLDGDRSFLHFETVSVNGKQLSDTEFTLSDSALEIPHEVAFPSNNEATIEVVCTEKPAENTALDGLYRSSGTFCTQMEANGFRRFTYHVDRPDVLSLFNVHLEAPKAECPVLLSNGNLKASGESDDGKTIWADWEDPNPKPSYLFAIVAGKLEHVKKEFTTRSGRNVDVRVWAAEKDIGKCHHALDSVLTAMHWDEKVYGREYHLDRFNVVAIDDFNMGAMENTSLNIFNTKYVLANKHIATDTDFTLITDVVGHEYFHNWTGNRVTLRDWLQLTLKEGLTVFRDQEFTADVTSRAVQRIDNVTTLRAAQFSEDAGSLAHPVRPDNVISMNNIYTATVYNKGAEVIRMASTLLGPVAFRKATDLYFQRFDGKAVTCDDWISALEDALVEHSGERIPWKCNITDPAEWERSFRLNFGDESSWIREDVQGNDADPAAAVIKRSKYPLAQFRLWYNTAGTPTVYWHGEWDAAKGSYKLMLTQLTPPTANDNAKKGSDKAVLHIPIRIGLIGPDGNDLPLKLVEGSPVSYPNDPLYGHGIAGSFSGVGCLDAVQDCDWGNEYAILHLTQRHQTFEFVGLSGAVSKATSSRSEASRQILSDRDVESCPVIPSLLRGFSAPIRLSESAKAGTDELISMLEANSNERVTTPPAADSERSQNDTLMRMAFDSDPFTRWDASNSLAVSVVMNKLGLGTSTALDASNELYEKFATAFGQLLVDEQADPASVAMSINLPALSVLIEEAASLSETGEINPADVAVALHELKLELAKRLFSELVNVFKRCSSELGDDDCAGTYGYTLDLRSKGLRSLRAAALRLLMTVWSANDNNTQAKSPDASFVEKFDAPNVALNFLKNSKNMTDAYAALLALAKLPVDHENRKVGLHFFFEEFCDETLAVDKWLRTQALYANLDTMRELTKLDVFMNWRNPNKIYSTLGPFVAGNPTAFHAADGSGYDFLREAIEIIDPINPQVAARFAKCFSFAPRLPTQQRQVLQKRIVKMLADHENGERKWSENTLEILNKVKTSIDAKDV